jgi:hypothetical protein
VPKPGAAPGSLSYPVGWYSYHISGLAPGSSVTVSFTLPAGVSASGYEKCESASCSALNGVHISGQKMTLTLTDGGPGDADGVANGVISDPGAPSAAAASGGSGSSGGGAVELDLLAGLALIAAGRRLRRRSGS